MTDRISALTVALANDIRVDDIQGLVAAIGQLRGVAGVTAEVVDHADYVARMRADGEWRGKVIGLLKSDA
jgi:hypothetical protein